MAVLQLLDNTTFFTRIEEWNRVPCRRESTTARYHMVGDLVLGRRDGVSGPQLRPMHRLRRVKIYFYPPAKLDFLSFSVVTDHSKQEREFLCNIHDLWPGTGWKIYPTIPQP
jgi:hypothetical protein